MFIVCSDRKTYGSNQSHTVVTRLHAPSSPWSQSIPSSRLCIHAGGGAGGGEYTVLAMNHIFQLKHMKIGGGRAGQGREYTALAINHTLHLKHIKMGTVGGEEGGRADKQF